MSETPFKKFLNFFKWGSDSLLRSSFTKSNEERSVEIQDWRKLGLLSSKTIIWITIVANESTFSCWDVSLFTLPALLLQFFYAVYWLRDRICPSHDQVTLSMAFIDYRCQKRVELIDLYLYISACFNRHCRCLWTDVKKNIWHEKAIISGCYTENHGWNISLKSVDSVVCGDQWQFLQDHILTKHLHALTKIWQWCEFK